jgi:hypothetical protein
MVTLTDFITCVFVCFFTDAVSSTTTTHRSVANDIQPWHKHEHAEPAYGSFFFLRSILKTEITTKTRVILEERRK